MYKVRKREGKIVSFDINKIDSAIKKAFDSVDRKYDDNVIDFLALKVTADFEPKLKNNITRNIFGYKKTGNSINRLLYLYHHWGVCSRYVKGRSSLPAVKSLTKVRLFAGIS